MISCGSRVLYSNRIQSCIQTWNGPAGIINIFSAAVHCGRWGVFCIRLHLPHIHYMCYSRQNAALDVTGVCDLMLLHIGDAPDLHSASSRFRLMIECVAFSPQDMEISLLSDEVFTSFN